MALGSQDPPGSDTPHRVPWPQDRRIHLDPTPLTGFCGCKIVGSPWILHPSQGSVASGLTDLPGSCTPHRVLWLQDCRIHLDPTPFTRFCGCRIVGSTWILHPPQGAGASGSQDPPGSYTPQRVLWPQDRRIQLDPTPLTGFCGCKSVGSTWILHPSQGSEALGSKEPPGSCAPTGFWGLRIEAATLILHPSQGSGASRSQDPFGSYTPYKVQ